MSSLRMQAVRAVDYGGNYAYARGSRPAVINLDNLNCAVLLPPESTRNPFDPITRLTFNDGSHLDVFGAPADFEAGAQSLSSPQSLSGPQSIDLEENAR